MGKKKQTAVPVKLFNHAVTIKIRYRLWQGRWRCVLEKVDDELVIFLGKDLPQKISRLWVSQEVAHGQMWTHVKNYCLVLARYKLDGGAITQTFSDTCWDIEITIGPHKDRSG